MHPYTTTPFGKKGAPQASADAVTDGAPQLCTPSCRGWAMPVAAESASFGCASRFRRPLRPAVNGGSTSRSPVNGADGVSSPVHGALACRLVLEHGPSRG